MYGAGQSPGDGPWRVRSSADARTNSYSKTADLTVHNTLRVSSAARLRENPDQLYCSFTCCEGAPGGPRPFSPFCSGPGAVRRLTRAFHPCTHTHRKNAPALRESPSSSVHAPRTLFPTHCFHPPAKQHQPHHCASISAARIRSCRRPRTAPGPALHESAQRAPEKSGCVRA